jgi:hypothetical protein
VLATASDSVADAVWVIGVLESVAVTVKVETMPGPTGVPVMAPVPVLRLSPAGSDPEVTAHSTGAVPPVEVSIAPGYVTPNCPAGSAVVVTASVGPLTVMDSFFLAVTAVGLVESVAVTVNVEAPATEGVPEIAPVALLRLSPVGSFPEVTDQVTGGRPPLAARPTE